MWIFYNYTKTERLDYQVNKAGNYPGGHCLQGPSTIHCKAIGFSIANLQVMVTVGKVIA